MVSENWNLHETSSISCQAASAWIPRPVLTFAPWTATFCTFAMEPDCKAGSKHEMSTKNTKIYSLRMIQNKNSERGTDLQWKVCWAIWLPHI